MIDPARGSRSMSSARRIDQYDASQLFGLAVAARDGDIGKVHDLYFDDDAWALRYFVIDTGGWLTGRKVLLSPHAVERVVLGERLYVDLNRDQIEQSPDFDNDKPVSRQYESSYYAYYGYPNYWLGPYAWGLSLYPGPTAQRPAHEAAVDEIEVRRLAQERERSDPHLRSVREVRGYHIEATDGALGHIESFLVDARSWEIEGIVIDTRNWLPGRKVLVAPHWMVGIEWAARTVAVDLDKERVRNSPPYSPDAPVNRGYEERLYDFYGRPAYWT